MPEELHRHHRARRSNRLVRFLKTYWIEILIVVGLVLAVFLLFEQMNIRGMLLGWAIAIGNTGTNAATRFIDGLLGLASHLGLSELIAIPMLIGVLALLVWRVRWRLRHTSAMVDLHCPRCGSALQRVHRRFSDKVVSILVPVRRYHCTNRDCGWSGRRVSTHSDRRRAKSAPQ